MSQKVLIFLLLLVISLTTVYAEDFNSTCSDTQTSGEDLPIGDVELNETKNQTSLTSQSNSIYYKSSYNVVLTDSNTSLPLSNKNVNFNINNVEYTATTDINGFAGINLNLNPGIYSAVIYFSGDADYNNCSLAGSVEILPTIKANDIMKYYKANTPFSAQFLDGSGNVFANQVVAISVNGKVYHVRTNANGFANLQINLKPGAYRIVSTDPLTGFQITTTYTILSTITSGNTKQVAGQNKKFTVTFLKNNGKALSKKYVKYKFKGKIHKVKTNSRGQFSISLKKFKKGTYKIKCYNKDGLSKTFKIKIYKRKASTALTTQFYTFFANDNKVIHVKLLTALGDNSNAGKKVKIKINGVTYSRKTDGGGNAYLNLNSFSKGLYKVECRYNGNSFFKSSKTSNYVTILDSTDAKLTVKSTKTFGYGAGTLFKVALTAGGVPLIKRSVTLNIAGVNYNLISDDKGVVSLPINLGIGKYAVSYNSYNQFNIRATSGSCEIEVFKRTASKLSWQCGSTYKDSSQTFEVFLTDAGGNPISGGVVELTIDGEKYTDVTSSSGHAIIKTDVALGNYKVSVKFIGNNEYTSSGTSNHITVKLSQFGNGLNGKNTASYSSKLLKSSSHCKVGTAKLKSLVKSLTKGLKSKVDKAKAIFNYVRDNIRYKFYYNSHHGSTGTLKYKSGNCADKAHLLVAMYRTAGFKTRYVHGKCKFNSGNVYGHVWAQVHVGKYWICADSSDDGNSLGKIANWNIKSYKVHAKYSSLPF